MLKNKAHCSKSISAKKF